MEVFGSAIGILAVLIVCSTEAGVLHHLYGNVIAVLSTVTGY